MVRDTDNEDGTILEESELLVEIVKSIVNKPEKVTVEATKAQRTTILTITVDPTDRGQVIGKDHMTIGAIKHLFSKAAFLEQKKVIIQVEGLQEFNRDPRPRIDTRPRNSNDSFRPNYQDYNERDEPSRFGNGDRDYRPRKAYKRSFTPSY